MYTQNVDIAKQPYQQKILEWGSCHGRMYVSSLRHAANDYGWKIVISTDLNPNYLEFLPSSVLHWSKLGAKVSVAVVVTENQHIPETLLKSLNNMDIDLHILQLSVDGNLPVGHAGKIARSFLATRFGNQVVTIVDIDYYLIWADEWKANFMCAPEDALLTLGYNRYIGTDQEGKYPMYLSTARSSTFAKFLNPSGSSDFNSWIQQFRGLRIFDHKETPFSKYGTFSDESLFRAALSLVNIAVVAIKTPSIWQRIDRRFRSPVTLGQLQLAADVFPNRPLHDCKMYVSRTMVVHEYLGILDPYRDATFVEMLQGFKFRDWAQVRYQPTLSLEECLKTQLVK